MGTIIRIVVFGVLIIAILALLTPIFTPIANFINSSVDSEIIDMVNYLYDSLPNDLKNIIAVALGVLAVGVGLDLVFRK